MKNLKDETEVWISETLKRYGDLVLRDSDTQWACLFLTQAALKKEGKIS